MSGVLVDVRSNDEWRHGHIKGAMHLSIDRIAAGELPDVPKNSKIILYCRSGSRAGLAEHILKSHGFSDVTNIGSLENASQYGPIIRGK